MKLKIVSDGTRAGTFVTDAETGEPVERVTRVEWTLDTNSRRGAIVTLTVRGVPVEIVGEAP